MAAKTFNLFVYGTFMERRLFRWVTGHDYVLTDKTAQKPHVLQAREAILASYQKISPDGMYFYAIPRKRHHISGYLIYDLPAELLELLDHYEGKRYCRAKVTVHQDNHRIRAHIYLANERKLRQDFGGALNPSSPCGLDGHTLNILEGAMDYANWLVAYPHFTCS